MKMDDALIIAMPGNEELAGEISLHSGINMEPVSLHRFPDGESLVKTTPAVNGKKIFLLCTLDRPDDKLLPLYFAGRTLKDHGAGSICLVAPYLAYMRQDKNFRPGEGVTSLYFAQLISGFCDGLITVDPHLHRWKSLSEIYSIPAQTLHAASSIADWIKENIPAPVLIGPDSESEQWVKEISAKSGAPFIILQKIRSGDTRVIITGLSPEILRGRTPVLADDIISTAHTMQEITRQLKQMDMSSPVCIGVHAIFAGHAYRMLQDSGATRVVTCNTVKHDSNEISLAPLLGRAIKNFYE